MRSLIIAAFLLAFAPVALAREEPEVLAPPTSAAPTAAAPIEERAQWCEQYASWLVAMIEVDPPAAPEARPTRRLEVELNSCTIDPQGYERQTRREAQLAVETASG